MTFEKRMARLEEIASRLESRELDLADALALFEEGVEQLRAAADELTTSSTPFAAPSADLEPSAPSAGVEPSAPEAPIAWPLPRRRRSVTLALEQADAKRASAEHPGA